MAVPVAPICQKTGEIPPPDSREKGWIPGEGYFTRRKSLL